MSDGPVYAGCADGEGHPSQRGLFPARSAMD